MATRPLAIKRKIHATAFRGFVAELRRDATLKRLVDVWRSWEGETPDDDAAPFGSDAGVAIRITPTGTASSRITIGSAGKRDVSLDLLIETYTPDGSVAEASDLMDVLDELLASDVFIRALAAAGIWDVEILSGASPSKDICGDLTVDSVRIKLLIST